jgi:hypothetical protein
MITPLLQITIDLNKEAVTQGAPYASDGGFEAFVSRLLAALMTVAAISVLTFLVWGAFDWLNSSGEKGKLESARNKMTGAIVGMFMLAMVLVIFMFVQNAFGLNILTIGSPSSSGSAPAGIAPVVPSPSVNPLDILL